MNIVLITSNICCFFFLIFLIIIYATKKNVKNDENRIYRWILANNFLVLLFELLFMLSIYYLNDNLYVIMILEKIYFMYVLIWIFDFTYYIIIISSEKLKSLLYRSRRVSILIFITIFIIIGAIMGILPVEHVYNEGFILYGYGIAPNFMAIVAIMMIIICMFSVIINRKKLNKKKVVPIFVFLILEIIFGIVNSFYPNIVLNSLAETLISYLMYFTIENPDIKLINQLELARDQAEKSNRAKTDFLSSMSHEIRTPLNAIVGFSECIDTAETLEEAKEDSKDIVMASQNLLEIVNGILDISKIEADKMELVNVEYNLNEILVNLSKLIKPRIGDKPIELKTSFAQDIPDVLYGDSGKVKQVITNILTNAAKYTDEGEINFKVNCVNIGNECKLVISVSDTGRGIKREQIDKLFTKFQRLDEDKNTSIEGTGLGLAITEKLVEMMGGKIVVQSEYGSGSTFTIYLSQEIRNTLYKKDKEESNEVLDFSNKKVLVVDDNSLNLKVATKILKIYNLDIECIESGFECINRIQNNEKYDLILLDIMMPKMGGVETLHKLKEIEGFNTPVVALTADALSGKANKYLENGFDDYASKPIEKLALQKVLKKFLSSNDDNKRQQEVKEEQKENFKGNIDYLRENGINIDNSMKLLGDINLYNEIMSEFINKSSMTLSSLKKFIEEYDCNNYSILVHSMKSDSKYLGFSTLSEMCCNHEMRGKDNDITFIKENFDKLVQELNKTIEIAEKYLKG